MKHLVIGDPHAKHGEDNRRFDWLGHFILKHRPDVVVCIGDFFDMESLSSYDKGKKSFEGRRYKLDLAAGHDALERISRPMAAYNAMRRANKKGPYAPRMVMIGGNHDEGRQSRVIEENSVLDGTIGLEDFKFEHYGWEYIPFLTPVEIDGVTYQHYFTSGVMGRPIGGESPGLSLVKKQFTTCVQGHSHLLDFAHRTLPSGKRIWGVHSGCYFEHEENYAGPANKLWWRGLVMLHNVKDGDFDIQTISMDEMRRRFVAEGPLT